MSLSLEKHKQLQKHHKKLALVSSNFDFKPLTKKLPNDKVSMVIAACFLQGKPVPLKEVKEKLPGHKKIEVRINYKRPRTHSKVPDRNKIRIFSDFYEKVMNNLRSARRKEEAKRAKMIKETFDKKMVNELFDCSKERKRIEEYRLIDKKMNARKFSDNAKLTGVDKVQSKFKDYFVSEFDKETIEYSGKESLIRNLERYKIFKDDSEIQKLMAEYNISEENPEYDIVNLNETRFKERRNSKVVVKLANEKGRESLNCQEGLIEVKRARSLFSGQKPLRSGKDRVKMENSLNCG